MGAAEEEADLYGMTARTAKAKAAAYAGSLGERQ